jgi:hypothetical protein
MPTVLPVIRKCDSNQLTNTTLIAGIIALVLCIGLGIYIHQMMELSAPMSAGVCVLLMLLTYASLKRWIR